MIDECSPRIAPRGLKNSGRGENVDVDRPRPMQVDEVYAYVVWARACLFDHKTMGPSGRADAMQAESPLLGSGLSLDSARYTVVKYYISNFPTDSRYQRLFT
jgi:hypothetical protein